jgi:hypothetical protein
LRFGDFGFIWNSVLPPAQFVVPTTPLSITNRHYFADPETNLGSPYFGQVTGMGWQSPRQGQLDVRLEW